MAEEEAKLKVYFDIDGVLFPWDAAARAAFAAHRGYTGLVPSERWDHLKEQVRATCWKWLWRGPGIKHTFNRPDLHYPGAPAALRRIGAIADLNFVTHRPATAAPYTATWIGAQRCTFTSLHVLGAHVPKSSIAYDADVVIDDKPEVVMDILENTTAHVFAPRRAYNTELHDLDEPRLTVYDDIKEVVKWVRTRTQQ